VRVLVVFVAVVFLAGGMGFSSGAGDAW
jgi:hypothetical protein